MRYSYYLIWESGTGYCDGEWFHLISPTDVYGFTIERRLRVLDYRICMKQHLLAKTLVLSSELIKNIGQRGGVAKLTSQALDRASWWTKCFVFHFSGDTTPQFLKTLSVYFFWPVKGQHERIRASKFLWQLLGHEWDQGQWMRNCVCLDIMCKIDQEWRIGGMDKLPLRNSALYLHDFGFQVKQGSHWQGWAVPPGRFNAGQVSSFLFLFIYFFKAKSAGIKREVADSIPGHNITSHSSRMWSENDWWGRLWLCLASPFALQWKHFIILSVIKILYDVKIKNINNASVLLYYFLSEYLNFILVSHNIRTNYWKNIYILLQAR